MANEYYSPGTERRRIPTFVHVLTLIFILLFSCLFSGVFTYDDLTIFNVWDKFVHILLHDWSRPFTEYTILCMGVGLVLWFLLTAFLVSRVRNFHAGREHGDAEWGDPEEITKRRSSKQPGQNAIYGANTRVALEGKGKLPNNNALFVGAPGTFKSTSVAITRLLTSCANFIVLDVKGELLRKTGKYLESLGLDVRVINLKNFPLSMRYNPFAYIEKEEDVIALIETLYEALRPDATTAQDPFWPEGARLYLQSLLFYEWLDAKHNNRKGNMNNVLRLVNDEIKKLPPEKKDAPPKSVLQVKMDKFNEKHPGNQATRDYRKLKEGNPETVRSIVIIVNALLKLFETKGIQHVFGGTTGEDDIRLLDFATGVGGTIEKPRPDKRIALFLITDDQKQEYNFICSMIYGQAISQLSRIADEKFADRGGLLPIRLEILADEFYAGARPPRADKLIGTLRSRNIAILIFLQSISQLKDIYPNTWQVIVSSCAAGMFMGCGPQDLETMEFYSKLIGTATIDTVTDAIHGSAGNLNFGRTGMSLITPQEIGHNMPLEYALVFLQGERPFIDRKALPWEMDEKIVPYERMMQLHGKKGYVCKPRAIVNENGDYFPAPEEPDTPLMVVTDKDILPGSVVVSIDSNAFLAADFGTPTTPRAMPQQPLRNISGGIDACFQRLGSTFTKEEAEELLSAIQDKLPDPIIKGMMLMPSLASMQAYHRQYLEDLGEGAA